VTEVRTPETTEEEVKTDLSLKEMQEAIELAEERAKEAEERAKRAAESSEALTRSLEAQRIDHRLDTEFGGVSPAFRREIRPFLLSDAAEQTAERIDLSEDGKPVKTEVKLSEQLWKLLGMVKDSADPNKPLTVELGTRGEPEMEPMPESKVAARTERIRAYMQENGVGHREAARAVSLEMHESGEEVV